LNRHNTGAVLRPIVMLSLEVGLSFSLIEGIFYLIYFPLSSSTKAAINSFAYLVAFLLVGIVIFLLTTGISRVFFKEAKAESLVRWCSVLYGTTVPFILLTLYATSLYSFQRMSVQSRWSFFLLFGITFFLFLWIIDRWTRRSGAGKEAGTIIPLMSAVFWFINAVLFILRDPARLLTTSFRGIPVLLIVTGSTILLYYLASRLYRLCRSIHEKRSLTPVLLAILVVAVVWPCVALVHAYRGTLSSKGGRNSVSIPPNVILIVLDTARRDHFSLYGYTRQTTPFLDSLGVEDGTMVFQHAITPAPWTLPAHASLFTGLYPSAHGVSWANLHLSKDARTLAEFLHDHGYQTFGLSNNAMIRHANGMTQGFDLFMEMWRKRVYNPTLRDLGEWTCRKMLDRDDGGALRTNQWISDWFRYIYDNHRPFFLFVNYMELHLGPRAPSDYRMRFVNEEVGSKLNNLNGQDLYRLLAGDLRLTDGDFETLRDLYDGDLLYLDMKVGELIHFLNRKGLLDNTLLVITSDHGENIGDHGMIDHQLNVYDTCVKVPLVVRLPRGMQGLKPVKGQVQLVDLFPTVMKVAGLAPDGFPIPLQGSSIVSEDTETKERPFSIVEYMPPSMHIKAYDRLHPGRDLSTYDRELWSIRTDSLKYIGSSRGRGELFDIRRDPGEEVNLIDRYPAVVEKMESLYGQWSLSFSHAGSRQEAKEEGEEEGIDEETLKVLKSLGYVN